MAQTLQQIQIQEQTAIPPLSQSRFEDMGCEVSYVAKHIQGLGISGPAAERGIEIHKILKKYVRGLVTAKRRVDADAFNDLMSTASQEAYDAISNFPKRYELDWDKVIGTELHIRLDNNFKPVPDKNVLATYEGTIDLGLLHSPEEATIPDYKSFFAIVEADSFQAKFYPLLLMCLIPSLKKVKFVLEFVRYGASRSVVYTSEDKPKLMKMAQAARARQIAIHERYNAGQNPCFATPGNCCTYCPKLANGCPVVGSNPWATMTPEERVAFGVWLKAATKQNTEVLKSVCMANGPVVYRDENDKAYEAGFQRGERKHYPLLPSTAVLTDYVESHPGDSKFAEKLTVGGLSSPLKAKMRGELAGSMAQVCVTDVVTKFSIGKADEDEEEQ